MRIQGIRSTSDNEQLVQEKRDQIVKNAVRLFAKKGMERTSMKDIGKACGMTSANLYNYIGKKEDLVTLVIQTNYSQFYKQFINEASEYCDAMAPEAALVRWWTSFSGFMISTGIIRILLLKISSLSGRVCGW